MTYMNNQPIGVLDSGIGGLSVWRELVEQLPQESTLYIADSKHCPYGNRSAEEIHFLAKRLVQFLIQKQVKLIVVACNTITVSCLDKLRIDFPTISLVGIVPVVKTAVTHTKNKKIGILSTQGTAKSEYQKHLLAEFAQGYEVLNVGTDKLVPFIEKGDLQSRLFYNVLKAELHPFIDSNIDTLALGCSHFPFIKKQIQHVLGSKVQLLDSGGAVGRQVKRVLEHNKSLGQAKNPTHQFFTTGEKEQFKTTVLKLFEGEFEAKIRRVEQVSV